MKTHVIFLLSFALVLICNAQPGSYDIVITNISILDTRHKVIVPNRTLYVTGGRIVRIEKSRKKKIKANTLIDGSGKFISPGFWDMHVHVCWKDHLDETLFPTLLSYGITGVRDMGGSLQLLTSLKKKYQHDIASSPTLFGAGPILDGENPVHPDVSIPLKIGHVKHVLDSLHRNGADFFKVYSLLPKHVLDSISIYSNNLHVPFSGHISEYVTPEDAVRSGQKSFEHLNRLEELGSDTSRLADFIQLARMHNTWICPTLIIYSRKHEILNGRFEYHALYESLDSDLQSEWEHVVSNRQHKQLSDEEAVHGNKRYETQKKLVKAFYDHHIPLLLGSDFAGMPFVYPGYSLHEEMKLLSSIGIPTHDILQMATYHPAEFLGITESYGAVEVNKIADLIIFSANPIENIENSTKIDAVLKAGQLVRRQ